MRGADGTWSPHAAHAQNSSPDHDSLRGLEQALFTPALGQFCLTGSSVLVDVCCDLLPVQISCACLPNQVRLPPCERQAKLGQSSDCQSLLLPVFASLRANGSESIQR